MDRRTFWNYGIGAGVLLTGCFGIGGNLSNQNRKLKGNINHSVSRWCFDDIPLDSFLKQIKKFGIKYPSIITHPKTVWGIQTPKTLPATYFISPEGEIVFTSLKPQDEASLSLIYEDLQNGA